MNIKKNKILYLIVTIILFLFRKNAPVEIEKTKYKNKILYIKTIDDLQKSIDTPGILLIDYKFRKHHIDVVGYFIKHVSVYILYIDDITKCNIYNRLNYQKLNSIKNTKKLKIISKSSFYEDLDIYLYYRIILLREYTHGIESSGTLTGLLLQNLIESLVNFVLKTK